MSDIGFPGLERLLLVIFALVILVPPLLWGALLLLVRRWSSLSTRSATILYFVLGIVSVTGLLVVWSNIFKDPDILRLSLPIGMGSTAFCYGIFVGLRRFFRGGTAKKLAL